jgi:hypothetical protein
MSVVDPEDALTAWPVQRQRISDAMGPRCIRRHPPRDKLDPVPAADLGVKTIKIEQAIETFVTPWHRI